MKMKFAVAMSIATGLCFAGHLQTAFAGHWVEVGVRDGPPGDEPPEFLGDMANRYQGEFAAESNNIDSSGTPHNYSKNYTWESDPHKPNGFFYYGGDAFWGSAGGSSSITSTGKRKSLFRWMPDFTGDPVPDTLNLKITASAYAEAGSDDTDQYRDISKEHVQVSAAGESAQTTDNHLSGIFGNYVSSQSVSAKKLVQIATNGQTDVWGPWIDFSATASLDGGRSVQQGGSMFYLYGNEALNFGYSAQPDNRMLRLSRPGAIGEITIGNTTYGHSRFSYNKYDDGITELTENINQQYLRYIQGDWGFDGDWNWSPSGQNETAIDSTQTSELGTMKKDENGDWYGSPTTPRVQTTTYTLKDPDDDAVGTAIYELILHDEWENLREDTAIAPILQDAYFPSGPSINNLWVENANGPGEPTGTWSSSIAVSESFGIGFDVGLSAKDVVNLGYSYTTSVGTTFGTEFGSNSPPIPIGYHCYPYVRLHWYRKPYLVDHYISAGQDRNPARLNANGETDGTHDGSWEGWIDDYQGGFSVGWSDMWLIDDFDGDGLPD